jgi:hypothetical protein
MDTITKKPDGSFKYGTLQEAERRLAEKQQERKMTLCPLMNATCRADCVCYVKPTIVDQKPRDDSFWDCRGGYCNCYSLMGPN